MTKITNAIIDFGFIVYDTIGPLAFSLLMLFLVGLFVMATLTVKIKPTPHSILSVIFFIMIGTLFLALILFGCAFADTCNFIK